MEMRYGVDWFLVSFYNEALRVMTHKWDETNNKGWKLKWYNKCERKQTENINKV